MPGTMRSKVKNGKKLKSSLKKVAKKGVAKPKVKKVIKKRGLKR
jgi:hypothetical protein